MTGKFDGLVHYKHKHAVIEIEAEEEKGNFMRRGCLIYFEEIETLQNETGKHPLNDS